LGRPQAIPPFASSAHFAQFHLLMSLKKLGRYDLIRVLGKGAMGLVYEGRDPNLDRRVAIKTIKVENLSEEAAAEYEVRFRTEARSAARLQHPHIVSVYDSDRDGDIAFLVMEFIAGDDLKHHLDKGDLYSLEQTLGIMGDLLSALDYAHRQSIVHRDIKPANLLIETSGRVKLTDFGVARIQDSGEATRTQGSMVGTLKYMSPEQVQGRPIDARADLFAAGIVLYQLLTGKRPFDGDTDFATIQQIVGHTPAPPSAFNSRLPAAIDAVVSRSLAKSRDQRYATAQEFLTALQSAAREASDTTVLPPAVAPGPGSNSTWTSTMLAGEALVDQPSGTSANISVVTQELELVYWKDIKESMDVEDIQGFLTKFPSGIYADLARRRLKKLGASGGEDSDVTRLSTGTLIIPRPGSQTMPPVGAPAAGGAGQGGAANTDTAWKALEEAAAQVPVAPYVPPAPDANDPDATRLGAPVMAAAQPAPKAAAPQESSGSSEWPETVFSDAAAEPMAKPEAKSPVTEAPGAKTVKGAKAAKPGKAAVAAKTVDAMPAGAAKAEPAKNDLPGAVPKSGTKTTGTAKPPAPKYLMWGMAGVVVLAGIGIGIKLMSRSGAPAAPSAAQAAQTPETAAAAPGAPAAPAASEPVVQAAAAAQAPAPASAASQAAAPLSPASRAALALAAANKKAALEKERQARQAGQAKPGAAAPATTAAEHAATPAPVAASGGGPRQACEGRMLIGLQICLQEQCAKPAFTNHPVCAERRAMEQRRRDAEQFSR
jgi:serine/threonine protein kinase